MDGDSLRGCGICGLVQTVGAVPQGHVARCARCGAVVRRATAAPMRSRVAALSVAALILYPLSMALPVLEVSRMGHVRTSTIWSGVVEMLAEGELAVGLLILCCSVLIPLMKLGGMLLLCWREPSRVIGPRARAVMFRLIDWIGRWGMVDVLLVAVLVAAVKLGNWVDVHPGPGVAAFAGVVMLSLLASAIFDPHAIWEDQQ